MQWIAPGTRKILQELIGTLSLPRPWSLIWEGGGGGAESFSSPSMFKSLRPSI